VAAALGADEAVPSQLTHDYFVADRDFHRVIFRWAGNRYLADMDAHLGAQVHRMRQAVLRGPHDVREAIAEHAAIVAAFAGDDPDAPAAAMYTHICNVRDRSLQDAARAWPTR
jgi:DNA-binding GntR family transcriptional regulator